MFPKGWSPVHGIICMWSGSRSTIPDGWVECDGQNGTPDMRMKFPYGGSASYPPGTSAGRWSHTHHFTSWTDQHTHSGSAQSNTDNLNSGDEILSDAPNGHLDSQSAGHGHALSIDPDTHSHYCEAGYQDHTPPFRSLLFIMKL